MHVLSAIAVHSLYMAVLQVLAPVLITEASLITVRNPVYWAVVCQSPRSESKMLIQSDPQTFFQTQCNTHPLLQQPTGVSFISTSSPTQHNAVRYKHERDATGSQKHSRQRHQIIKKKGVEMREKRVGIGQKTRRKAKIQRGLKFSIHTVRKKEWMWKGQRWSKMPLTCPWHCATTLSHWFKLSS